jgi:hypothetical protein
MRPVWLAAQRAHHIATNTHIASFNLEDLSELDLPMYLKDLDDFEYFSVIYSSTNISNLDLHPQLIEAALLSQPCTRAIYTFWHMPHYILGSDADLKHIRWMRRNPYPDFIAFAAHSAVVPYSHDYILLTYETGEAFVVDVTAAQFGCDEWMYKKKEYEEMLVTWRLDPAPVKVEEEIRAQGEWDCRVRVIKEVVEECVQEAEERWDAEGINWDDVCWIEDEERERMCEELADDVRERVLDVLKVKGYEGDEGYESQ